MARLHSLIAPLTAAAFLLVAAPALAGPYVFTYGGRLANSSDIAVNGPVNLELKFYRSASGGNAVGVSSMTFAGVPLEDGVFQVDVTQLTAAEMALVFDATQDTYVEITDRSNNVTYPRQHLSAMPYAMKVPVDGKTVVFDSNGNLSLAAGQPSANQFLTKDGSGNLIWGSPAGNSLSGQTVSASTPTNGQVLSYNSTLAQWVPTAPTNGGGTGVTSVSGSGPISVATGTTTPVISMTAASGSSAGYISASDYTAIGNALSKLGGTMSGTLNMGGNTLSLGSYSADPALSTPDKGKIWYNATTNVLKFWNGSAQTIYSTGSPLTVPNDGLTVGSNQLVTYGGNVGLGTSFPQASLHINGSNGIGQKILISSTSSSRAYSLMTDGSLGSFKILDESTTPVTRLTLDINGNFGLNTTTPTATLDVNGPVKLGATGTAISAVGVCSVASTAVTYASEAALSCNNFPASTAVAVTCSPNGAFSPISTAISCRGSGSGNTIYCHVSTADQTSMNYTCLWIKP